MRRVLHHKHPALEPHGKARRRDRGLSDAWQDTAKSPCLLQRLLAGNSWSSHGVVASCPGCVSRSSAAWSKPARHFRICLDAPDQHLLPEVVSCLSVTNGNGHVPSQFGCLPLFGRARGDSITRFKSKDHTGFSTPCFSAPLTVSVMHSVHSKMRSVCKACMIRSTVFTHEHAVSMQCSDAMSQQGESPQAKESPAAVASHSGALDLVKQSEELLYCEEPLASTRGRGPLSSGSWV